MGQFIWIKPEKSSISNDYRTIKWNMRDAYLNLPDRTFGAWMGNWTEGCIEIEGVK